VKILFLVRHFAAVRNYEAVVERLANRGHTVHIAALQDDAVGGAGLVARLAARLPGVCADRVPEGRADRWAELRTKARLGLDCLRYLEPAYRTTPRLWLRAAERTPRLLLWFLNLPGARTGAVRRSVAAGLRDLESAIPEIPAVEQYLRAEQPDLVMLTPLIGLGSPEQDYLVTAKALGIRTVACVWSWDNLSSKSLIRAAPDVLTVWNETQQEEAVRLHGLPADRVAVTGAQCFDQWFDRSPTRDRATFCARVGLPSDRPLVLYVCSALFRGSPSEAAFVRRWTERLRMHPGLQEVALLVRPHPSRLKEWETERLDGLGPVSIWGANPIDGEAKADYFDSLHHSTAVVGLNTSAFLEAAVAGRPVLTVLLPEFRDNQEGTLHFRYLLGADRGLLHADRDLETHLDRLARAVAGDVAMAEKSAGFVRTFLRPAGRPGTDVFVDVIERVLASPAPCPEPRPAPGLVGRTAAVMARAIAEGRLGRSLMLDPREADEARRRATQLRQGRRVKRRARLEHRLGRIRLLLRSREYRRKKVGELMR
jgi:hypothetical protein